MASGQSMTFRAILAICLADAICLGFRFVLLLLRKMMFRDRIFGMFGSFFISLLPIWACPHRLYGYNGDSDF